MTSTRRWLNWVFEAVSTVSVLATVALYSFGVRSFMPVCFASALTALGWLLCREDRRKRLSVTYYEAALFLLWLLAGAGMLTTVYRHNTLHGWMAVSALVCLAYLVRYTCVQEYQHVVVWAAVSGAGLLVAAFSILSFTAAYQFLTQAHLGELTNLKPAFGMLGPGIEPLGTFLALLPFPLLTAIYFRGRHMGVCAVATGTVVLLLVAVGLTLSRGLYVGCAVSGILGGALLIRFCGMRRWRVLLAATCVAAVAAAALLPVRAAVATTLAVAKTPAQVRSVGGRFDLWRRYLRSGLSSPVFGAGKGNLPLLTLPRGRRDQAEGPVPAMAFNTGLLLFVEEGIAGMAAYAAVLSLLLWGALRLLRNPAAGATAKIEVAVFTAAIAGLLVRDCTTTSVLTHPATAALTWLMAALIAERSWGKAVGPVISRWRGAAAVAAAAVFVAGLGFLTYRSRQLAMAESKYGDFISALRAGDRQSARASIDEAIELAPDDALLLAGRGLLAFGSVGRMNIAWPLGRIEQRLTATDRASLSGAAADFSSLVRLNRGDALAWHNLGWADSFLGRHEAALSAFENAVRIDQTDWVYRVSAGLQYETAGMTEKAVSCYTEGIRLGPHLVETPFFLDFQTRHPELAAQVVQSAFENLGAVYERTNSPVIAAKLGRLALYRGDLRLAVDRLDFATRQSPLLYRAWTNLGRAWELSGRPKRAERYYRLAFSLNPFDAEAAGRLAGHYASAGDVQQSKVYSERADANRKSGGTMSARYQRITEMYHRDPDLDAPLAPAGLLEYCSLTPVPAESGPVPAALPPDRPNSRSLLGTHMPGLIGGADE